MSAPRAPRIVPVGKQGTAWRWLASQVALDPDVKATGALVSVAGGAPCEGNPTPQGKARIRLDALAESSDLYATRGPGRQSYRAPVLLRIEVESPVGQPPEDLLTLYARVEQAAYRAAINSRAAAKAQGVAWVEPGIAPRGTPDGGLVGAVRIVVFLSRP